MDLSKAERQTPERDNRQSTGDSVKGILQYFLFFLVYMFFALLLGWFLFFVVSPSTEWLLREQHVHHKVSKISLQETTTVAPSPRPCQRARHWIQLYIFRTKKAQQEEQVQPEPQPEPQPQPYTMYPEMGDQPRQYLNKDMAEQPQPYPLNKDMAEQPRQYLNKDMADQPRQYLNTEMNTDQPYQPQPEVPYH